MSSKIVTKFTDIQIGLAVGDTNSVLKEAEVRQQALMVSKIIFRVISLNDHCNSFHTNISVFRLTTCLTTEEMLKNLTCCGTKLFKIFYPNQEFSWGEKRRLQADQYLNRVPGWEKLPYYYLQKHVKPILHPSEVHHLSVHMYIGSLPQRSP